MEDRVRASNENLEIIRFNEQENKEVKPDELPIQESQIVNPLFTQQSLIQYKDEDEDDDDYDIFAHSEK